MDKSETIGELAKALSKVQSQLRGAKQDSNNPFYKSKYADLSSVWEACRGLLTENELAVLQTTDIGENHQLIVETMIVHSSGEWVSGQTPMLLAKQDPQGIGSAITYGRRYGLSAIVGICPEDDDAEIAMGRDNKGVKNETTKVVKGDKVIVKLPIHKEGQVPRQDSGEATDQETKPEYSKVDKQIIRIRQLGMDLAWGQKKAKAHLKTLFGKSSTGELTSEELDTLEGDLQVRVKDKEEK